MLNYKMTLKIYKKVEKEEEKKLIKILPWLIVLFAVLFLIIENLFIGMLGAIFVLVYLISHFTKKTKTTYEPTDEYIIKEVK